MAASSSSTAPRIWRVAYVEGGPFTDYQQVLRGLTLGLQQLGLIENGAVPVPENSEEAAGMWAWLAEHAGGTSIHFIRDGFYSANWDAAAGKRNYETLRRRIEEKKDVDLLLSFGTSAGQYFSASNMSVPAIMLSVTNAVEAGISISVKDSGHDNIIAPIEPDRFKRQVMLFHDIFKFKKLGIAYEDSPSGRSSIALGEIERAARDLGIDLLRCNDTFDVDDAHMAAQRLTACHARLAAEGADAVYLTYNRGMQADVLADVLAPLSTRRIPTFSQNGVTDVAHGALLSISQANLEEEGMFGAGIMAAIIKGAKPRSLSPIFESSVSLALNLRMATLVGWNPPLEILAAVDDFYQDF
ncbi:MAG: ABC transporter substrate-binding protein [Desulfovibrio sp.]|nr:ABC transporter substrate-binding protein [Desulfovibrio sp.]